MDLDFLFPMDVIEGWRKFLEECAGKKCIPVWHINRGLDYWGQMVKDYDYVLQTLTEQGKVSYTEKPKKNDSEYSVIEKVDED